MFFCEKTAHLQHNPRPDGRSISQKDQSPTFSQTVLLIEILAQNFNTYDSLKTVSVAAMVNMDDKHVIRENRHLKCRVECPHG